ncbi:unnamed protein product [Vitrella brassicaformis CCMP3155]|uniref:DUF2306 domain-containing protein n=2 Tax=Vitrella brassicaformis TaxID=1169539 RepID=A0A0G4G1C3_VITBC|nr:unnamed protein product [Vitrella brassicaformis CCMP3155]|eukprot:CEM21289.1 unnamed protein product [Vitrella brassicaformis CCMP3155]
MSLAARSSTVADNVIADKPTSLPRPLSIAPLALLPIALAFFVNYAVPYARNFAARATYLYHGVPKNHVWLALHIPSAAVPLLAGPVQIALGLSRRGRSWPHRVLGWIIAASTLISIPPAMVCAFLSENILPHKLSLIALDIYWTVTLAAALYFVKNKNIQLHRDFMIRYYAATLTFVTNRMGTHLGGGLMSGVAAIWITFLGVELLIPRLRSAAW